MLKSRLLPSIETALIAILLALFCARIWDLGITFHDDAVWALRAHQPDADPVGDWAKLQGRFYAYPAGLLMLHALAHQSTFYGEVLQVGGFVMFFVVFHAFVAAYAGRRIALGTAALFLSFNVLRWDGSMLTAHPLYVWVSATLFLSSLLVARCYIGRRSRILLALVGLCLFASLFTNEGLTFLYCLLFPLTLLLGDVGRKPTAAIGGPFRAGTLRDLAVTYVAAVAACAVISLVWLRLHPSQYPGHSLASFNPGRIAKVLVEFATSGFVLHDVFKPYSVVFSDAMAATTLTHVYAPFRFVSTLTAYPLSLLAGLMTAVLCLRLLTRFPSHSLETLTETPALGGGLRSPEFFAVAAGLVITFAGVLPVAMTQRYQEWYFQFGASAYGTTIVSCFGICLFLAGLLSLYFTRRRAGTRIGIALAIVLALLGGVLAAVTYRMNDVIAEDLRPESGRWRVLQAALRAAEWSRLDIGTIWAPRFRSGSWFDVLPASYWSEYAQARYRANVAFVDQLEEATPRAVYLDYTLADDDRSFIVTLAALAQSNADGADRRLIANRIVVAVEAPSTARLRSLWLIYEDDLGVVRQVPLSQLAAIGGGVLVRDGILADPASIRIARQPVASGMQVSCPVPLPAGRVVRFGTDPAKACFGGPFLQSGWGGSESVGVWSAAGEALISIPSAIAPSRPVIAVFDLSTFAGLGFYQGTQTVRVVARGQQLATWRTEPGSPPLDGRLVIPPELREPDGRINLTFRIDPPLNPKKLGLSVDDRNLGVFVRSLKLDEAAQ
ncbi:hypothetical protein BH10PSE9_BH10PSE9_03640 [soil metagenome]